MLCRDPIVIKGKAFGCGQCLPCRVNKRRVWSHRILLEAALRKDNAFVTLTYSEEKLPRAYEHKKRITKSELPTLNPKHPQDWLKRFRKAWQLPVRYYLVGEYGETSERPHYHAVLFGYPTCEYGRSRYGYPYNRRNCCRYCDLVRDTWGFGLVDIGEVNESSAQYIGGYVTKKMTGRDDFRLQGRFPEFARMSLRGGGLGADMMDEVASTLMALGLEVTQADVPSALRHGSRLMPLGRYLTRRLRTRVGKDAAAPEAKLQEIEEKMRPVRQFAFDHSLSYAQVIRETFDGAAASLDAKQRIHKKRGNL